MYSKMAQPEAYIGGDAALFDNDRNLINDPTKEFRKNYMKAFKKGYTIAQKKREHCLNISYLIRKPRVEFTRYNWGKSFNKKIE